MKKDKNILYDKNGYFNAKEVIEEGYTFILVTGARGTGKTYSTIKYLIEKCIKNNSAFIYLRRTQDESDLQANESTSSLTKVLRSCGVKYKFGKLSKKVGVVYVNDQPLIYTCALSTFSSIRGVNFDNVEYAIYDEFIPELHVRSLKANAEGVILMNFYESVNRNRELEGERPLILIGLSNSMNIANDIFMEFDLVSEAERLSSGENDGFYTRGNIELIIMKNSPISKRKEKTALYQSASEQFAKMAIKNEFIMNDFTYVQRRNLKEYVIVLQVGDLYLFKHKSDRRYYVTFVKGKTKRVYTSSMADLERFRRAEWRYYERYLDGYVYFDSYKAVALFEKYYK